MLRFFILLAILLVCGSRPALAQARLAVDADAVMPGIQSLGQIGPGLFSVNIDAVNVADVGGFQFDLAFDPTVLSAVGVTEGDFLANNGATFFTPGTIDNTNGTISFVAGTLLGQIGGGDGTGILASIQFQTLTNAPAASDLTLSNTLLLDSLKIPLSYETANGQVRVVPEPSGALLLTVGMMGLGGYWKRRKRRDR